MTITFCPNCNRRIITDPHNLDFIHDCSQEVDVSKAITEEDVPVMGAWEDFSGSGEKAPEEVTRQGILNELLGTRAGIEGFDEEPVTPRGARKSTHRQRGHLQFIDFKESCSK